MVHPADGTDTSIPLKCVDDERVWIGSAHINRCQLIESLPSLPDEIAVPFTEDEVSTWCTYWDDQRSSSDVGFLECVSILKVADFLHDQDTVESAVKAANAALLQPSRKRKLSAPRPKEVSKRFVTTLQSLPAHVSQKVLIAGGQLQDWMRVLPPSCLPIMVPAAVDSGTLRLRPNDQGIEDLAEVINVAKSLDVISNLEVVFGMSSGIYGGMGQAEGVAAMTQLKSLKMVNVDLPDVSALTALTRLILINNNTDASCLKLSRDISILPGLKDLAVVNLLPPSFESLAHQLSSLTALTTLELRWSGEQHGEFRICGEKSAELAAGIAACTSLATLTLELPQTVKEASHLPVMGPKDFIEQNLEPVGPQLSKSIVQALSSLPSLTSLTFGGNVDCEASNEELEAVWRKITALRSLTFQSEECMYHTLSTVKHLPALENFQLFRSSDLLYTSVHHPSTDVPHWFPTSLTRLQFHIVLSKLPDLTRLSHLQSIELGGCQAWCDGRLPPSISQLTGLKTFSTGPPYYNDKHQFFMHVSPIHGLTPECDLEILVSALPKTLCELRLPDQWPSLSVVASIASFLDLTYLEFGIVPHQEVMEDFSKVVSKLCALQRLRVRWEEGAVSHASAALLMETLNGLPCFREFNHGPDPSKCWDPSFIDGLKFRLVS